MYCGNCGEFIDDNAVICTKCGSRVKEETKITGTKSRGTNLDLSGLSPYYQQEFQKIYDSGETYKGKFNVFAFLFTPIWLLIKGCWLTAIVAFAVNLVSIPLTAGLGGIACGVLYGFRGTYVYYCAHVKGEKRII